MKKVTFTLEEIISQKMTILIPKDADVYEYIRQQYKDEEIIVTDPTLTQANVMIEDEDGVEGDWVDLHVSSR